MSDPRPPSPNPPPPAPRRARKSLLVILAVMAVIGGVVGWQVVAHLGLQSTDNAQLEAEIVPIPARLSGTLVDVRFVENQRVAEGEVLARVDDAPARARLAQAEAALVAAEAAAVAADADVKVARINASGNLGVAQATRTTAESAATTARTQLREAEAAVRAAEAAHAQALADRDRDEELHRGGVIPDATVIASRTRAAVSASNRDAARAHLTTLRASIGQAEARIGEAAARVEQTRDVETLEAQAERRAATAHAQVEVAKAALVLARIEVEDAVIRAPKAGVLSKKTVAVGQMVSRGQPIAQLVTDGLWVTANLKETQLADVRPGQPVEVEVDAFPGARLTGQVESLAGATGARFSLLPPDNATGNFTKVVQRVPIRVRLVDVPDGLPLRAGMSVSVTVDTRHRDAGATGPTAAVTSGAAP